MGTEKLNQQTKTSLDNLLIYEEKSLQNLNK